jgi:hypothetical protein
MPDLREPSEKPQDSSGRRFAVDSFLRPSAGQEAKLRGLLAGLEDLGCFLYPPTGDRDDYINVHCPGIRGRIASVNVSSGRVEFQNDSWRNLGDLDAGFVHLEAGNKAALALSNDDDVDNAVKAAALEIGRRRSQ